MTYQQDYARETGRSIPVEADKLTALFAKIELGKRLPPLGQQAANLGLPAHSLNDSSFNPALYRYYHWVIDNKLAQKPHEMSAKLIGMEFICCNLFDTNLPQPITLNPWQVDKMDEISLTTKQAVIVENNGVFIWLHELHPDWPLINQGGNDFNDVYLKMLSHLASRGLRYTYLGDLDSTGIRMADTLWRKLSTSKISDFTAIQSPQNVVKWLVIKGREDQQRTRMQLVENSIFQQEMDSVQTFGKYVEQEQLIEEYETLVPKWLA